MMMTTTAAKDRVPVIRVSRQFPTRIHPHDKQDDSENQLKTYNLPPLNERSSNNNPQQNEITTKITTDSLTSNLLDDSYVRSADFAPIQQQPTSTSNPIRSSYENRHRPHVNWKNTGKWSHGLCTLCDDFNMFCYACSCWCCFRHEISSMMNEHWCLWYVNCSPLMELRTKFRQQYGIRGSIAEDFCLSTCCPLCVGLQLANEGREYGHRIFV